MTRAAPDKERLERVRQALENRGIDLLVCRLPENVLYVTGHWPMAGTAWAFMTPGGGTALVLPSDETGWVGDSWADTVETYVLGDLRTLRPPAARALPSLVSAVRSLGVSPRVVAWEMGFDMVSDAHWQGELRMPWAETNRILHMLFPEADVIDSTSLVRGCRRIKSAMEIGQLRKASDAAILGLRAAANIVRPGVLEIEVAAAVESTIHVEALRSGLGRRIRAFASVMSGPRAADACRSFNLTADRALAPGDLVLVELGVCIDGYWSDLTRVYSAGEPTDVHRRLYRLVHDAQMAGLEAMRPGVKFRDVDKAARSIIAAAGFGPYFPHPLGHAIGLAYHEPPYLHPAADGHLEEGDVFTVEPGVYHPDWGGLRLEEDVAVSGTGIDVLSTWESPLSA
jgi:Xaa-Pro dipeptidase